MVCMLLFLSLSISTLCAYARNIFLFDISFFFFSSFLLIEVDMAEQLWSLAEGTLSSLQFYLEGKKRRKGLFSLL